MRKINFLNPIRSIAGLVYQTLGPKNSWKLATSSPWLFTVRKIVTIWGKKRIVMHTKYGFRLNLELSAYLFEGYLYLGEINPLETKILRMILKKGDIVFDVGANIGWYSLNASTIVGPHGKVFAFEPNPSVALRLRENCELNNVNNVQIVQAAVSDSNGQETFWIGENDAFGSLIKENASKTNVHDLKKIRTRSLTLDSFVKQGNFSDIRFIKIDTEGTDLHVIQGAKFLLKRFSPYLMIEIFGLTEEECKDRIIKTLSLLKQLGYMPYEFTQSGLRQYNSSTSQLQLINLFFAKDKIELKRMGLLCEKQNQCRI